MRVGVPTEITTDEHRVAITPAGVRELVDHGKEVVVEQGAGLGSAITDDDYVAQGARIVSDADEVFAEAELIVKVKEPQRVEVEMLRPDHVLLTYLHLAPDPALTRGLVESGVTCVAYETVRDRVVRRRSPSGSGRAACPHHPLGIALTGLFSRRRRGAGRPRRARRPRRPCGRGRVERLR